MLYLAVREQEMRHSAQGWLYNYVVNILDVVDDDLEFDVYDRTHANKNPRCTGAPRPRRTR